MFLLPVKLLCWDKSYQIFQGATFAILIADFLYFHPLLVFLRNLTFVTACQPVWGTRSISAHPEYLLTVGINFSFSDHFPVCATSQRNPGFMPAWVLSCISPLKITKQYQFRVTLSSVHKALFQNRTRWHNSIFSGWVPWSSTALIFSKFHDSLYWDICLHSRRAFKFQSFCHLWKEFL